MMKEGEKADAAFYEPGKSCRELLDELEKPCRELVEEVKQGMIDGYIMAAEAIKEYYKTRIAEIAEAYEQGKKDAWMWTPISESRPPIEKPVLVCDCTGYRNAAILKKSDYGVYMWQTWAGLRPYEDIVAWQKLPEPYKEECTGDSCPISYKD